jgi:DNA-binding transcriptional MerR regulator
MATRKKIEKSEIEIARQKLLEAIYSELPDDRFVKREAVKQLLSTLIAARERGLAFEKIAEILQQSGLDLPAETLRTYFFELKTQSELAVESIRHAKKIAQTREAIQKQVLDRHADHAHELASNRARRTQETPRLVNAFGPSGAEAGPKPVPLKKTEPREQHAPSVSKGETARPASPAAPLPPPAAPEAARINSEGGGSAEAGGKSTVAGIPTSEKSERGSSAIRADGAAMTLTAIEAASMETEARTDLLDDVELREGELVFYVSGQPFSGFLSQRQIRLLRTVGRIIAPTKGRSSKDFVSMPTKL